MTVRSALSALLLFAAVACRAHAPWPPDCHPVTAPDLPAGAIDPDPLAGRYRLSLVASQGPHAGATEHADLHLVPQLRTVPGPDGRPLPGVTLLLRGTLEGDPGRVGAIVPGGLLSEDPRAPGVAVLHTLPNQARSGSLLLRLGAEANRRGRFLFDEVYTVLRVQTLRENGFSGEWGSGGLEEYAAGYFCAVRLSR